MASSNAYYSNAEDVLRRESSADGSKQTPKEDIFETYEIARCSKHIKDRKCKKVALQFPDSLLVDATSVAYELEKACGDANIYIMADTSYGHCDIDEVNAKHVDADLIIHYGESGLTQSATVPALHVFGKYATPIDCEDVKRSFREAFPVKETTRIVFLHHVMCNYVVGEISQALINEYLYLSIGQLNIPTDPGGSNLTTDTKDSGNVLADLCTKSCPGCTCRMEDESKPEPAESDSNSVEISQSGMETDSSHPQECKDYVTGFYTVPLESDKSISDYEIFYLGPKNCQSLQNFILSHPSCKVHVYDPETGYEIMRANTNRQLMKRYCLVEKAKDARLVGILVGTMGVSGYLQCLNYMKEIAKFAGKKTYTFIMGKLTPEKLANYLEIDIYVLIANPEHSILDSADFYRPVVTPYEFSVACNPNQEWTSHYITDFREILPGGSKHVELPANRSQEVTFSLVTGNMRGGAEDEDFSSTSNTVALRNEQTDVAVFGENSSAQRLSERSWKGLEQSIGATAVSKAKEGRSGLAVSYNELMEF